jgi:NAD(P)-dependent dehydrogenase (short-subunit alcohol dehydrogenase family)
LIRGPWPCHLAYPEHAAVLPSGGTQIDGRVAVVTGAGSGIGRALAQDLARRGCPLVLADKDEHGLADTAEALAVPVLTRTLDVSDRWALQQLASDVRDWGQGELGVVLNNAGLTVSQTIADSAPEELELVMNVNFWGVVYGTQAFLPLLQAQDRGALVNVSSIFGIAAFPSQGIYCASKFAVKGFTESLRHELRDTGVRVHCVHPGGIKTNIARNMTFHVDDRGSTDRNALERDFDKVARTSPARAAEVILGAVERGRERVLIGADARALDRLVRVLPSRYYDFMRRLEPLVRR